MKMISGNTIICFILFLLESALGIVANPNPLMLTQPDGNTFIGYIKGDEWQHWYETKDGYTISKNDSDIWVYVLGVSDKNWILSDIPVITDHFPDGLKNIQKHIKPDRFPDFKPLRNIPDLNIGGRSDFEIPMLLVEFPDLFAAYPLENFNNLMNQEGYISSQGETGSFRDFYHENSYDTFDPNTTVLGWFMADSSYLEYGSGAPNGWDMVRQMIAEAVDDAEEMGVDWSQFDNNNDGYVDALNVVHAGLGAEEGGVEIYIWSHAWELGQYQREYDGVIINNYIIMPERTDMFGAGMIHIGVFCHEFGHALGLPDLYDTDYSSSGIGIWGLMSGGSWGGNGGSPWYPSHMCAWSKTELEWVTPDVIDEPVLTIDIPNVEENPIVYRMDGISNPSEYFLFENRQRLGFDQTLVYHGLLIWHIDESVPYWDNSDDWHRRVDLEQADGEYALNYGYDDGNGGDPYPGTMNATVFSFDTEPNSQFYTGDTSGVSVVDISEDDYIITASFRNIPTLTISSMTLTEVEGDSDGVINPGETATVLAELFNPCDAPVDSLIGIPFTTDPDIIITTDEITLPDVEPFGYTNFNEEIVFSTSPNTPLGIHSFFVQLLGVTEENPFEQILTFEFELSINQVGFPYELDTKVISSPLALNLDEDEDIEIIFGDYEGYVHVLNSDGSEQDGSWPYNTFDQIWGAPAGADINNDGTVEIVITSKSKKLYVLDSEGNEEIIYNAGQYIVATPAIGNLDEDENLEIVFGSMSSSGKLYAINPDGSDVDGFPVEINEKIWTGVALADFNENGKDDIVFGTDSGNLHLILDDGSSAEGFPFYTEDKIRSAPIVGSFNDGALLVIFVGCDNGNFYAINSDGSERFSVDIGETIRSSPSIVENNGDAFIFFTTKENSIFAIDLYGAIIEGWPKTLNHEIKSSCVFSDIDDNGTREVVTANRQGELLLYSLDGFEYPYFPLDIDKYIECTPMIADVDVDSDLEIIVGNSNGLSVIDVKEIGILDSWSLFRGNTYRNGFFESTINLGVSEDNIITSCYRLYPAYPNPFNPITTIRYELPEQSFVTIVIYDILGRTVKQLVNSTQGAGFKSVQWNATDSFGKPVGAGIYLYQIRVRQKDRGQAEVFTQTHKMLLLK
ncbi:MAG: M6 family metalloprotease domain-containing protein [Candidatus Marinimicrobia bacterium]|nr:M6 family metalloprotease domain-containing protein [Candidatus Neomarinimicrobiota bacterium]